MAKRLICPYCFRFFDIAHVDWRCMNEHCVKPGSKDGELAGEPDLLYTEYLSSFDPPEQRGKRKPVPKLHAFPSLSPNSSIFSPWKKLPRTARCDWCGNSTTTRLCPHCHNELPYTTGTFQNHIVSVIGAKAVGKSHYIAVLIEQLRQRLGDDFDLTLLALNDATTTRFHQEFFEPLYRKKRQLVASQRHDIEPLMYRLQFKSGGMLQKEYRALTLIFFDTAGENFDADTTMGRFTRYLVHSSAIIMLLDPLQISNIRDELKGTGCPIPDEHTEPIDIMDRVIRHFQQHGDVPLEAKIPVPMAISFTKSDVLRDHGILPKQNSIYSQSAHHGQLDREICTMIHDEVQSLLHRWSGPGLENLLRQYVSDYTYFCMSALGGAPNHNGNIAAIAPFRVEDPFLWAMSKLGYLDMN